MFIGRPDRQNRLLNTLFRGTGVLTFSELLTGFWKFRRPPFHDSGPNISRLGLTPNIKIRGNISRLGAIFQIVLKFSLQSRKAPNSTIPWKIHLSFDVVSDTYKGQFRSSKPASTSKAAPGKPWWSVNRKQWPDRCGHQSGPVLTASLCERVVPTWVHIIHYLASTRRCRVPPVGFPLHP